MKLKIQQRLFDRMSKKDVSRLSPELRAKHDRALAIEGQLLQAMQAYLRRSAPNRTAEAH